LPALSADGLLELRKNTRGQTRRKAADGLLNYVSDRREMIRYRKVGQMLEGGTRVTRSRRLQAVVVSHGDTFFDRPSPRF
jgi:hypothetical protein